MEAMEMDINQTAGPGVLSDYLVYFQNTENINPPAGTFLIRPVAAAASATQRNVPTNEMLYLVIQNNDVTGNTFGSAVENVPDSTSDLEDLNYLPPDYYDVLRTTNDQEPVIEKVKDITATNEHMTLNIPDISEKTYEETQQNVQPEIIEKPANIQELPKTENSQKNDDPKINEDSKKNEDLKRNEDAVKNDAEKPTETAPCTDEIKEEVLDLELVPEWPEFLNDEEYTSSGELDDYDILADIFNNDSDDTPKEIIDLTEEVVTEEVDNSCEEKNEVPEVQPAPTNALDIISDLDFSHHDSCDLCKGLNKHTDLLLDYVNDYLFAENERKLQEEKAEENNNKIEECYSVQIIGNGNNTNSHKCNVCDKEFSNNTGLIRHVRTHTNERSYKCHICQKGFTLAYYLKRHMRTHSGEKPYECDICKKRLTKKISLISHMRMHAGEKPYKCNICRAKFSHRENFKAHVRIHLGKDPFGRIYYNNLNISKEELQDAPPVTKVHDKLIFDEEIEATMNIVKEENGSWKEVEVLGDIGNTKVYKCNNCDKEFSNNAAIMRHVRTHTREIRYTCNICDKGFTLSYNLKRHLKTHTRDQPYECDVCQKRLTNKFSMVSHMRIHTGEKPYTCKICDAKFSHGSYFSTHMRKHLNQSRGEDIEIIQERENHYIMDSDNEDDDEDKRKKKFYTVEALDDLGNPNLYKCDICYKQFSNTKAIMRHVRIHNREVRYKCDVCGKGFTLGYSLKRHMRTHTGEKPYQCDICKKKVTKKISLLTHMRIHTGEKPYACKLCDAKFSHRGNFRTHTRNHTQERPYKCEYCNREFNTKFELQEHTVTHTRIKSHECNICKKKFSHKYYLKQHRLVKHTELKKEDTVLPSSSEGDI